MPPILALPAKSRRAALRASVLLPLMAPIALGGCGAGFLPDTGPGPNIIGRDASITAGDTSAQNRMRFALVRMNAQTSAVMSGEDAARMFTTMATGAGPNRPVEAAVGIGDMLAITIFESQSGGLFIPADAGSRAGNFVALPTQQVDESGMISVPYAGKIKVDGLNPLQIQSTIERRLANRALEPQAVVSIVDRRADAVAVLGDVSNSLRYSMDPGGDTVLNAVARAGGPKNPGYESLVTVQRRGHTESALLSTIATTPEQNIQLQPGDTVYVEHRQRFFTSMGAIGQSTSLGQINRRIAFEDTKMSLQDALSKAGGIEDDRANPTGVFLFRMEPRSTLVKMLGEKETAGLPDMVPTIFTFDMMHAESTFYAQRFPVHAEDAIYVSNAPATDISKFETLVLPLAYSAANFRSGFQ